MTPYGFFVYFCTESFVQRKKKCRYTIIIICEIVLFNAVIVHLMLFN